MRMLTTPARPFIIEGRFPVALPCGQGPALAVFVDSEVRDAFDRRGRVRSTGRHHQGGDFLAVRVEFSLAWSRFCMHHGF